jgi:hypothetical protein
MGERMGRIGQIQTDFFYFFTDSKHTPKKKSVCIRPIRSPIVSQPYHHIPQSAIQNPKSA